jgi:hypothetical protein
MGIHNSSIALNNPGTGSGSVNNHQINAYPLSNNNFQAMYSPLETIKGTKKLDTKFQRNNSIGNFRSPPALTGSALTRA